MSSLICNTDLNDVRNGLQNGKDRKVVADCVVQVGKKRYDKFKDFGNDLSKAISKAQKSPKYIIHPTTFMVHKKGCGMVNRMSQTIPANLINLKAAGIPLCKHCLKDKA